MKKWSKTLLATLLCTFVMALIAVPCTKADAASKIKISSSKATIAVGESQKLSMKGTKKRVTWTTSNKKIAKVVKGKVTGVRKGKATITAKIGTKKYRCKVNVEAPKLSKTKLTLTAGKTATIKLNGNSRKVTWYTSNKKVAKVSGGKITAVSAGKATITAKVGSKKYICKVTVNKAPAKKISVQSIKLNKTTLCIEKGTSYQLSASINPGNATNKKVVWSSTNSKVATVDQRGKVQAVGRGTAQIKATCDGKTTSCYVTVTWMTDSYNRLLDYINKNGKQYEDGIKGVLIENPNQNNAVGVGYDEDRKVFMFVTESFDNNIMSGFMWEININSVNASTIEYIYVNTKTYESYETKAQWNPMTYTSNTKLNFKFVENQSKYTETQIQGPANSAIGISLKSWNEFVKKNFGLSLDEFGIREYKF